VADSDELSPAQREALLQDLFGRTTGIGLSFTRLTIGASDFSRTHYSFDDVPPGESDSALRRFSIDPNRADVLPVVKRALAINPSLGVIASPWSAPAWMKTTGSLIKGTLRAEAYAAFADYLRRYVQAYEAEGVPIFAIAAERAALRAGELPGMRLTPSQRATSSGITSARCSSALGDDTHPRLGPQLGRACPPLAVLGLERENT
jgi:glucosylceramidase